MSFYQSIKQMKAAVIGSIIPWSGPLSDIPDGWIICDGTAPDAKDYPLLVQTIGDTYNEGVSTLGGGFPNYTGEFKLPDLLGGRSLIDMEGSYFTDPSSGIDTNAARTLIEPFIGENTDNGMNTVFNDVLTDVYFTLNDRNDYQGAISGNIEVDGQGEKTVFIGGRKLSHQHIRNHQHPGAYETLQGANSSQPGLGVVPYSEITMRINYAAIDVTSFETGTYSVDDVRIGLKWYKEGTELYNNDNLAEVTSAGYSGFGTGQPGRTVGVVQSEKPPINLSAKYLIDTPLATWGRWQPFPSTPATGQPFITTGDTIPYGLFGENIDIPQGFRNFYPDATGVGAFGTFVSNEASDFVGNPDMQAHAHDPFQVAYDQNSLKPQPRLNSTLSIPDATLDNTSNAGSLQITMNTAQPTLTCVYIIRAY